MTIGGRSKEPLSNRGSVRTTGVVRGGIAEGRQHVVRRGDVDLPVGAHPRVRGVLVVPSTIARYDVETTKVPSPAGAAGRPRTRPGRPADATTREVAREVPGPTDPRIARNNRSSNRRARNEPPNSSSVGATRISGSSLPSRPRAACWFATGGTRRCRADHEQLDGNAGEQRSVLPRRRAPFLEDRPRDVRDREAAIRAPRYRRDQPEQLTGPVHVDREADPGRSGPFAVLASAASPSRRAGRAGTRRSPRSRLDGLGSEEHAATEPAAVEDRELEPAA